MMYKFLFFTLRIKTQQINHVTTFFLSRSKDPLEDGGCTGPLSGSRVVGVSRAAQPPFPSTQGGGGGGARDQRDKSWRVQCGNVSLLFFETKK